MATRTLHSLRSRYGGLFSHVLARPTVNFSSRGGAKIKGSVVHTTESSDTSFDAIVGFFQKVGTPASSHYIVGALPDQVVGGRYTQVARLVPETEKAWTALTANPYFVQYELIGRAARTRHEWLTHYLVQLQTLAVLVADDVLQYRFPIVHGVPGIVGHRDLSRFGFPQTHTDPGADFPWDVFLKLVHNAVTLATPTPPHQRVPVKRSRRLRAGHSARMVAV